MSLLKELPANYLVTLTLHNGMLAICCYVTGWLVQNKGVRVNYTRKINHFALMLIPFALAPWLPYEPNWLTVTGSLLVFVVTIIFLVEPIRRRVSLLDTAFAAVDRPEDRPHTILWILLQAVSAYIVVVALFFVLAWLDSSRLIVIPLIVNGIGDGLAEPIGVRFGRHRYRVPSLAAGRTYYRSMEGSACVFVTAVATIICLSPTLSLPVFLGLILLVPPVMTLTEACSPHSMDAPFMYASGGICIASVLLAIGG